MTPVAEDDAKIKAIWQKQYPLKEFSDPSNFKSYDELKEKLNRTIMGSRSATDVSQTDLPPKTDVVAKVEEVKTSNASEGEDDTMSYFSKLADED